MTEIELKIPISMNLKNIHEDLKPGRHMFTDDQMSSWFIKGLIENGSIVIVNKEKEAIVNKLDYTQYRITLGEGGVPSRMDPIRPQTVIATEMNKIEESEKESKWEKIVGKDEDLDIKNTSSSVMIKDDDTESKKTRVIRPKKVQSDI